MAEEAFALSPISARSASPTDADYDAIREAFMETARGRWFLGEYAKRNRNADTAMVLEAVTRLEQSIAANRVEAVAVEPQADDTAADMMAADTAAAPPSLAADEILVSVKTILERTRAALVAALSVPDTEQALSAFQRSARIIQEIAWGLRESGSDGRICAMLDAQVRAMTTACDTFAATEHRDAVLHAFDASLMQIGKLAQGDEADASAETDLTHSHGEDQAVVMPESRPLERNIPVLNESVADAAPSAPVIEATHTPTAMEAAIPPATAKSENISAPSLGDSLIARGIVAPEAHAKPDPLAPIRRMSQAEKIAFFS